MDFTRNNVLQSAASYHVGHVKGVQVVLRGGEVLVTLLLSFFALRLRVLQQDLDQTVSYFGTFLV